MPEDTDSTFPDVRPTPCEACGLRPHVVTRVLGTQPTALCAECLPTLADGDYEDEDA
jgi:hypothetical protein